MLAYIHDAFNEDSCQKLKLSQLGMSACAFKEGVFEYTIITKFS